MENIEIDLSESVVFAGPNNSGKTSVLQAIALWELGMRKWAEGRLKSSAKKRVGVVINRRDIVSIPIPSALQLWNDLRVRQSTKENGKRGTKNILIEILVEGFTNGKNWKLGFEFDYANSESIYCRIMKNVEDNLPMDFPEEALNERIGFLLPMSGLAAEEYKLEVGSIRVKIGEGRTAEILRNLCLTIWQENKDNWDRLAALIKRSFQVEINPPLYDIATGRITMSYSEQNKKEMDLSDAGTGFLQTLLLFAFIYANPNTILLLDEPDAHLEILRQKEIYNALLDLIVDSNSQLIIATHSEAILSEAADRSMIIAFLGKPHVVNDRSQLVKSLTTIGFDQYLLAEQKGWILYLEGSTDLSMLRAFVKVLNHPVLEYFETPFAKYVSNNPGDARAHFYALKEAFPELKGIAIYDNLNKNLQSNDLIEDMWKRREIENYLPIPEVIERYVQDQTLPLFEKKRIDFMQELIYDYIPRAALRDKTESWWSQVKMSDEVLDKIFRKYFQTLKMPILMDKRNYYELALLAKPDELDEEIKEKLDRIYEIANAVSINEQ